MIAPARTHLNPRLYLQMRPGIRSTPDTACGFRWEASNLVKEHRAHVLAVLPFVLLAACPLMHLFMHRGHSKRHNAPHHEEPHSTRH
jgi:hypothetical protein